MTERPPIPDPPHQGGCLCGAARYRLDAPPLAANACHCSDCKKLSGAAFIHMIIGPRAAFSHTGETHVFRKRAASGREADIHRCAVCGTRLWHEPLANPALVFIAAGTLDDTSWFVPASHIWIEQVSPGTHLHEDAAQLKGQPATREMLMDAFAALYGLH